MQKCAIRMSLDEIAVTDHFSALSLKNSHCREISNLGGETP
ncbi:hypothetical protein PRLR5052_31880 [Prevotella lacticifex]|nr:hypothetical protein PRLR5052_31880 [Prevotella lacticifex]